MAGAGIFWKVFIVAGSYAEAAEAAVENEIEKPDWVYLDNRHQLQGMRGFTIWYTGTWSAYEDVRVILAEAAVRDAVIMAARSRDEIYSSILARGVK